MHFTLHQRALVRAIFLFRLPFVIFFCYLFVYFRSIWFFFYSLSTSIRALAPSYSTNQLRQHARIFRAIVQILHSTGQNQKDRLQNAPFEATLAEVEKEIQTLDFAEFTDIPILLRRSSRLFTIKNYRQEVKKEILD